MLFNVTRGYLKYSGLDTGGQLQAGIDYCASHEAACESQVASL